MTPVNLSETISTWRERIALAGKTEQKAAQESGLTKSQLSHYLNGKNVPGIQKFQDFENYLRSMGV